MSVLIKNGTVITPQAKEGFLKGDVLVVGNTIKKIEKKIASSGHQVLDATDQFVIPGFIQSHTHLVQTLFRGEADDLLLLDWLKKKIWPMESAHNRDSIKASVNLGVLELLKLGTTSILDMPTVKHTSVLLEQVEKSYIRYWGGKCLMDRKMYSGPLFENTHDSFKESVDLITEWKNKSQKINYVLCPRFVVSCTESLLEILADFQLRNGLLIHIHASENKSEMALVKKITGLSNIEYLKKKNLLNPKTAIAHCIHVNRNEMKYLKESKTGTVHCPSSNLKLGSGIAPVAEYLKMKIKIGLGADGAPCNNIMDPFREMFLAAVLQKTNFGPQSVGARAAFRMATLGGAEVLGIEKSLGTLEVGKIADIVTVDRSHPSVCTVEDPFSALVYSCSGRDVTNVLIDGKLVIRNRQHRHLDENKIKNDALAEKKKLLGRI